ncbi:MAG TPA: CHAT domain-containing tetratricopeptide repeat protein [Pyrinomonadaceae bacterium]|nr:CHAT domain-containing tetratricopeptide repeat protein [Pyrinomonadaceae bacterium]
MPCTLRAVLRLLSLSLCLVGAASAQPQALSTSSAASEAVGPAALNAQVAPLMRKGDYAEALRVSQLAARLAEEGGERAALGDALRNLGLVYNSQNRPAQAMEFFQKSLAVFEEAGDKKAIARGLHNIGLLHRLQGRLDQALVYFNRGLALGEECGDKRVTAMALNGIGVVHKAQGRNELALEFYQRSRKLAEEINDRVVARDVSSSIGNVYQAQGLYEQALDNYRRSRALSEEIGDRTGVARAVYNIGAVYNFQGRYAEALSCFQESIKIGEELGAAADKRDLAYNFHSLGRLYWSQGRYEQSLEYYHKALKIREEVNDRFGLGQTLTNLGNVYKAMGRYEQALESYQRRLKLAEEMGVKEGLASSFGNLADVYRQQGRPGLALEHLRKSLRLREEMGDRRGICLVLVRLAQLYEEKGDYPEMLDAGRRATALAEEIDAPEELWKGQEQVGRALRALGRAAEARQSFVAAIATVERVRREVAGGEQQQQSFLENRLSPWLGMVELLVSRGEYAEALTFAEASKARVLLDALQGGREGLRQSLSEAERKAEEERRLRLVSLNSKLAAEARGEKADPARVAALRGEVEKARLEYEDFETRLYVAHPELRVQRGEAPPVKPEELASLVPDASSALLEYVVADDSIYLFAVTKAEGKSETDVRVYTLPFKREELAKQTEAFRQQLAGRDLGFRASASKLYELLLKPAEAQLRGKTSLVIAPDGALWDLPFQSLLNGSNRFLLEEAAVAYAPSLTVLREMSRRRRQQDSGEAPATLLALGNPLQGKGAGGGAALRGGGLEALPEAEQEVKALGRLYGAARSRVYTGAEAREDRFKSEAGRARVLHFAAHGLVNNASPMYSHLALAAGGAGEDGLLEAWELTRLDLKADLAVLSACETARGRAAAGEGVIGLSWAMFIAGVPSIVVSQWKVESAGTRELMVNFHRGLISPTPKLTKSEALRQAALKLLKNPETNHPFYWAGFVLVGEGS